MMWGGWTCSGCGAELNRSRQVIGGRVDAPDGIQVALRPAGQKRSRRLVVLGGFVAPTLAAVGLVVSGMLGQWLMLPTFVVMVALLGLGLVGLVGLVGIFKKETAILTDAAIRWGDSSVRPDAITEVRQDGEAILLLTDTETHRLLPLGSPDALLGAIEEVRQIGRVTGTAEDIPDPLRQLQADVT
ncbi:MAG: hypothetical protein ACI8RZ_000385 [Myxococcota bacterium]|jgi:hypothetical protein